MMTYSPKFFVSIFFCALVFTCAFCSSALAQQQPADSSLYTRIGGYDFVARFVDTAFPRVAGNPQLKRLFQGHSLDSQMKQRQLIVDALCQSTGGPCIYIGRPMKPLHAGLGITTEDWNTFMTIISATLDELQTSTQNKQAFLDMFDRFRDDVIDTL